MTPTLKPTAQIAADYHLDSDERCRLADLAEQLKGANTIVLAAAEQQIRNSGDGGPVVAASLMLISQLTYQRTAAFEAKESDPHALPPEVEREAEGHAAGFKRMSREQLEKAAAPFRGKTGDPVATRVLRHAAERELELDAEETDARLKARAVSQAEAEELAKEKAAERERASKTRLW